MKTNSWSKAEALTGGLEIADMSLAWPAIVQLLVFINSGSKMPRVLVLFIVVIYLIFFFLCFRYEASTELGAIMQTEFLCISVLRIASGPRVKLTDWKEKCFKPSGSLYY